MSKGRFMFRAAKFSAAIVAMAAAGVLLPVSPASARPIDCNLTVNLVKVSEGFNAAANVYCSKGEHYTAYVYIRREDTFGNSVVASGKVDSNGKSGWFHARASEPCSDVQTNKKYHAHGYIYDTTYGYPIEVKDFKTSSVTGHC
ncbi:hypothetical protein [Streptosporangium sp. NPDC049046]|uniref:hypothetical protein n=1 Tax=Streptosporangium sp. NPDC049046 TaxID=3155031 RepID=UPI00341B2212